MPCKLRSLVVAGGVVLLAVLTGVAILQFRHPGLSALRDGEGETGPIRLALAWGGETEELPSAPLIPESFFDSREYHAWKWQKRPRSFRIPLVRGGTVSIQAMGFSDLNDGTSVPVIVRALRYSAGGVLEASTMFNPTSHRPDSTMFFDEEGKRTVYYRYRDNPTTGTWALKSIGWPDEAGRDPKAKSFSCEKEYRVNSRGVVFAERGDDDGFVHWVEEEKD
jgi:hypothetical protein